MPGDFGAQFSDALLFGKLFGSARVRGRTFARRAFFDRTFALGACGIAAVLGFAARHARECRCGLETLRALLRLLAPRAREAFAFDEFVEPAFEVGTSADRIDLHLPAFFGGTLGERQVDLGAFEFLTRLDDGRFELRSFARGTSRAFCELAHLTLDRNEFVSLNHC